MKSHHHCVIFLTHIFGIFILLLFVIFVVIAVLFFGFHQQLNSILSIFFTMFTYVYHFKTLINSGLFVPMKSSISSLMICLCRAEVKTKTVIFGAAEMSTC